MTGDAPESAFAGRALNQWLDPLFAASDFWQRILMREREAPTGLLDGLEADLPRPLTLDSLTATLAAMAADEAALDRAACSALLRRFKYRMFLRAALRRMRRLNRRSTCRSGQANPLAAPNAGVGGPEMEIR
jgi:glutamine synthetase adenylyltransferase